MVERPFCTRKASGSNPLTSTKKSLVNKYKKILVIFEIFVMLRIPFRVAINLWLIEKGIWWMPWHQEAMKEAEDCQKLRGAVNQALIRRYPNGEIHSEKIRVFLPEYIR